MAVKTIDIPACCIGIICLHPIQSRQTCSHKAATALPSMPELLFKGSSAYCILSGTQGGIQFAEVDPAIMEHIKELVDTLGG